MFTVATVRSLVELIAKCHQRSEYLAQFNPGTVEQNFELMLCQEVMLRVRLSLITAGFTDETLRLWQWLPDSWLARVLADLLRSTAVTKADRSSRDDRIIDPVTLGRVLEECIRLQSLLADVFEVERQTVVSEKLKPLTLDAIVEELRALRARVEGFDARLQERSARDAVLVVDFRDAVDDVLFEYVSGLLRQLAEQACMSLGFGYPVLEDVFAEPDVLKEIQYRLQEEAELRSRTSGKLPALLEVVLANYCMAVCRATAVVTSYVNYEELGAARLPISHSELEALLK